MGYVREDLIRELEAFLGYDNAQDAVLVGAGRLGKALLAYEGFVEYGLNIVAGFDTDPLAVNTEVGGKRILPMDGWKTVPPDEGAHWDYHRARGTCPGGVQPVDQKRDIGCLELFKRPFGRA